jgi:nitrogen fixation protein FixH
MMQTKTFTGWHMTSILVGFFGIVIAVNLVMARYAVGTFGGTVVDNSYVASQKFNGWLAAADKENRLGWAVAANLNPDRHVVVTVAKDAVALSDVTVTATAHHPLGKMPEQALRFSPTPDGRYVSETALPAGRWQIRLMVQRGDNQVRRIEAF